MARQREHGHCSGVVRHYFRGRIGNTRDAEDLTSNTWLAAGRTFGHRTTLRAYLYAIARRMAVDYFRVVRRRPWLFLEREEPDDVIVDDSPIEIEMQEHIDAKRLRRAIAKIPDPFRDVVELVFQGYDHVEIAQLLGVNYNTVRSRSVRGKNHLLALLAADDHEWPGDD